MASLLSFSDKHRKLVLSLHRKKHRDEEKLFIAEGLTIVNELLQSTCNAVFIVVQEDRQEEYRDLIRRSLAMNFQVYSCTERVFGLISETQSPQGILAVVEYTVPSALTTSNIVALDAVQDPGNVGTIIRSAHFFGFGAVVLGTHCADQYNAKVIRSTMGSIFHMNVIESDLPSTLRSLRDSHALYGAGAHAKSIIHEIPSDKPVCLVIGSEAEGISKDVVALLDRIFSIPGSGSAESLNASVAAAISMFHFSHHDRL